MTDTYDPAPLLQRIASTTGHQPRGSATQLTARCPAHDDHNASLSIGISTDKAKLHCHAGCGTLDIVHALGLTMRDLFPAGAWGRDREQSRAGSDDFMPCGWNSKTRATDPAHRKVAEYLYRDQRGQVVFGVARCALKGNGCQGFRQWRPDPTAKSGRRWSRTLPDGTRVGEGLPYRLPELLAAIKAGRTVYVCEGEKDADRLAGLDYPATCNAQGGGPGKWTQQHAAWLEGAHVVVIADRDATGRTHAEHVVNTLMPAARSIEVVRAHHGKDISDHLDAGGTLLNVHIVAVPKPAPGADPDGPPMDHPCFCPTCKSVRGGA